MKHIKWMMIAAMAALVLNSCETEPTINESDLYGYWFNQSANEYMRIMHDDNEMLEGYYLGYEWKVGDSSEELLTTVDYHGLGWYKWKLENDQFTQYHLGQLTSVPKTYTITLSSSNLVLKDGESTKSYVKTTQPK